MSFWSFGDYLPYQSVVIGAKHPAFSTNHLTDIDNN